MGLPTTLCPSCMFMPEGSFRHLPIGVHGENLDAALAVISKVYRLAIEIEYVEGVLRGLRKM